MISLLRTIAGLWTVGNGMISRPADVDVYFLPQRPYCTIGTLKDQLLYPSIDLSNTTTSTGVMNDNEHMISNKMTSYPWKPSSLSDDDLLDILKQVDLYDIAVRSGRGNNADDDDDYDDDDNNSGDPYRGLYTIQDWSNQLSLGEQQRLAFGRLLVNRPALVILDEAVRSFDFIAC
jgi:vitamin B12/bleomycin/antimicrobial peptide transport system ATP-binding/permease protein